MSGAETRLDHCPRCGSDMLWYDPPMYDDYSVSCTDCLWREGLGDDR